MDRIEIIVIVLASVLVLLTIGWAILRRVLARKSGKKITSCGYSCANCPNASCSSKIKNDEKE
ncbi:MAG: hypothetical protein ACOX24_04325 [Christensenellales bacterium]|jgi:hypothetical protein|nr:hypothetical protein [Clostridiales bacterium]